MLYDLRQPLNQQTWIRGSPTPPSGDRVPSDAAAVAAAEDDDDDEILDERRRRFRFGEDPAAAAANTTSSQSVDTGWNHGVAAGGTTDAFADAAESETLTVVGRAARTHPAAAELRSSARLTRLTGLLPIVGECVDDGIQVERASALKLFNLQTSSRRLLSDDRQDASFAGCREVAEDR